MICCVNRLKEKADAAFRLPRTFSEEQASVRREEEYMMQFRINHKYWSLSTQARPGGSCCIRLAGGDS